MTLGFRLNLIKYAVITHWTINISNWQHAFFFTSIRTCHLLFYNTLTRCFIYISTCTWGICIRRTIHSSIWTFKIRIFYARLVTRLFFFPPSSTNNIIIYIPALRIIWLQRLIIRLCFTIPSIKSMFW